MIPDPRSLWSPIQINYSFIINTFIISSFIRFKLIVINHRKSYTSNIDQFDNLALSPPYTVSGLILSDHSLERYWR